MVMAQIPPVARRDRPTTPRTGDAAARDDRPPPVTLRLMDAAVAARRARAARRTLTRHREHLSNPREPLGAFSTVGGRARAAAGTFGPIGCGSSRARRPPAGMARQALHAHVVPAAKGPATPLRAGVGGGSCSTCTMNRGVLLRISDRSLSAHAQRSAPGRAGCVLNNSALAPVPCRAGRGWWRRWLCFVAAGLPGAWPVRDRGGW
jgi:hypothetical protein